MKENSFKNVSKSDLEKARLRYKKHLNEHCTKEEVIEILSNNVKHTAPEELYIAHGDLNE